MEPYHENINMADRLFPVRAFVRMNGEHIFAHPHWHDEIEILFILEGEATQQINDKIYNVSKGDIICISRNDVHSTYSFSKTDGILVIQFGTDFLMPAVALSPERLIIEDFRNSIEMPSVIKSDSEIGREILKNLMGILYEFEKKQTGYEVFIKARIFELVGIAVRNFSRKKSVKSNYRMEKAKEMLSRTFKLIDDNYGCEITLVQAAEISNLSISHFCRLFKKATGMTFKEYLTLYRVSKAEEFLSTGRLITEIGIECGFESMSSFIRAFKRYKNATPSLYRKQLGGSAFAFAYTIMKINGDDAKSAPR